MINERKNEMIEYILEEARKISKDTDIKKRERKIKMARFNLKKSTEEQVENLYNRVKEEGAEKVFSE